MIGVAMLVAFVGAVAVGIGVLVLRPSGGDRILRWAALGLTVAVVLLLTPYAVDDSGSAALYLLGVPVVAALLPVAASATGRFVTLADILGGVVMMAWGLLLALGIGAVFLPAAVLLFAAPAAGATRTRRSLRRS
jgi:hypothetical protein